MTTPPKVLLVDDHPDNLLALAAQLRGLPAEILKAGSGRQALDLLLAQEVAVALVDVQMPEMSGFELAEVMRASPRTREIPIIFVTAGLYDQARLFEGYEAGAVDFLIKPIASPILHSKVSVFLQLHRQKQELAGRLTQLAEAHEVLRVERDHHAWLASIPEENPDSVLRLGRDGRLLYLNPTASAVFVPHGCQVGALAPAQIRDAARPAFQSGESQECELQVGDRWYWLTIRAKWDEANLFARDVTDRKMVARDLLRSREGLQRLAEASLSVIARTDRAEMLQAAAEAALQLTGTRIAACGHGLVSGQYKVGGSARLPGAPACPPHEMFQLDQGGVHLALAEGAESIRLTDTELRAHPRWWGLPERHVPLRGLLGVRLATRDGQTNGMILVTDKEHGELTAEDEALLKQLGTVASLALQHVEARISLEEADRRKDQFLAMLSHELRNPLAPIRNSLYILDRAKPGGEQARRAQSVIDRQVGHLTRLVDDLLDVTRISRGKIRLQRERLDLSDLVRRAVEDYRDAFTQNQLTLGLSRPKGALWVNADPTRIAQVVGNLLNNACKFTPAGGKTTVSLERNAGLGQAVLKVRDTGIGIAPEMLPHLFEAFAQADTTLDRSSGGLGLGLTMVKGMVEMHGGTVSAESPGLGEGTEFMVRLPMESADVSAETPPGRRAVHEGPRRVLVIEDNVDAAESLRELLELDQHTVEVAFSGWEGLAKARSFGPDIVLCDIGLPGMDGYEVARAMRKDPTLRDAGLVALTGYAAPEDIAKAQDAGFDAHLAKPPSPQKLTQVLGVIHVR
jgi:signal transduction histidine kinase/response regulator RpfG family c-di-GMP phosphodiesterase